MGERDQLIEELGVKLHMLSKKFIDLKLKAEKLEQSQKLLIEENELLRKNIRNMKSSKMLSIGSQDIKDTRRDLTRLIHEVDRCIALLSV